MANSADTEWSQLEGNFTTNFEYSTGPPHSSSYVLASAPWINDKKPRAARMQAERQVKCTHERADSKYYRCVMQVEVFIITDIMS